MSDFPPPSKVERGLMNEYQCGCQVRRDAGGGHFIYACDLHNAARDLLKACRASLSWLLVGAPHANDNGGLLTEQLKAAIAKTTKGNES